MPIFINKQGEEREKRSGEFYKNLLQFSNCTIFPSRSCSAFLTTSCTYTHTHSIAIIGLFEDLVVGGIYY